MTGLAFDPAVSWGVVALAAAAALLVAIGARLRRLRGWGLRAAALAALALALAGPVAERHETRPEGDIVILIEDRSASQSLGKRAAQTDAAVAAMTAALAARPGTELRRVRVGDAPEGTALADAIARALAVEPTERVAGVIVVSDGLAADAARLPQAAPAPVHLLLTGAAAEWDRRLDWVDPPAFAVVGAPVTLRLRLTDHGAVPLEAAGRAATVLISVDGAAPRRETVRPGEVLDLPVTITRAGEAVVTAALAPDDPAPEPAQLTTANDRATLRLSGVRDRMRVLLVSGQPHAGERSWRNLLKSDVNIDLVHFTILRPPFKSDGVPEDELALIPFPVEELFARRLKDFDLILFDRYRELGILPPEYLDNLRRHVEAGGALIVSAGPEFAGVESLAQTPLADILPGAPTGQIDEMPFRPALTEAGRRHPVTAGLTGADAWGRWLRRVGVRPAPGAEVLLAGDGGAPLLLLGQAGEGRVALLASDQIWLWGRGFEGGGPQAELLRRIAHWALREPELEAETLRAETAPDGRLHVLRRSMEAAPGPVTITDAAGRETLLPLHETAPGRFAGDWAAPGPGAYRLRAGALTAVGVVDAAFAQEWGETVANPDALAPLVTASGGGVARLSDGVPQLRAVRPGRPAFGGAGSGSWIGITPRGAETLTGLTRVPLLPGWLAALVVGGLMLLAWRREVRRTF